MQFTPIDLASWPRRQVFWYFSQMAPTSYSITVDADVTGLRQSLKNRGLRLFPTYLWLVTGCLMQQQEFRLACQDDILGCWDTLTPLYAAFHDDDQTFSLMWTEYDEDLLVFHQRYLEDQAAYGGRHGLLSKPGTPPPNAYTVSCVPWISFQHFAVHTHDNKPYYFPSVEAGKIHCQDGRELLPLSITCHHAAADGWHVHRFLTELQRQIDLLRRG